LFALEQQDRNDLARFAPTILLSPRMPTISFNVSAFSESSQRDSEIDEDLRKLNAELEALALEPEEDDAEFDDWSADDATSPGDGDVD
jgi:hypothetical protein